VFLYGLIELAIGFQQRLTVSCSSVSVLDDLFQFAVEVPEFFFDGFHLGQVLDDAGEIFSPCISISSPPGGQGRGFHLCVNLQFHDQCR
jgi:hypothetical protein